MSHLVPHRCVEQLVGVVPVGHGEYKLTHPSSPIIESQQSSSESDSVDTKLEAYLAEYRALRTEMEWLIKGGGQYQNFAIALLGAAATLVPWIISNAEILLVPTLMTFPFLFSLLGFLYLREHEEIYVVAAYLKDYLRPRIRNLLMDPDAWGWEEFKEQRSKIVFGRGPLGLLSTTRIILVLRSTLFLLPSIACLVIVADSEQNLDITSLLNSQVNPHFLLVLMGATWYALDALIVFMFFIHLWSQSDLSRRILRASKTK